MITPILMLGAGRMGGAMLEGWRKAGAFTAAELMIRDPQPSPPALACALDGAVLNPHDADLARAATVVLAVKPQTMGTLYAVLLWIAGAAGVLALLPRAVQARPTLRYWIGSALLLLAGIWLPGLIVGWVPKFTSFGAQTASMIVRFALAYAIALAAWLAITALARGPRSAATA